MTAAAYVGWYGKGRKQNWRTPRALFDALHAEFRFTLDGASEARNGLLPRASTADAPLPWTGERVFCNPPWSDIASFVELAPHAECAVLLVPARVNTKWWHRALALGALPRWLDRRPSFEHDEHTGKGHNSPVDCCLLVFDRFPVNCPFCEESFRLIPRSLAARSIPTGEKTNA